MKRLWLFIFFANSLFAAINVTVSILPQKYFVRQIAGKLANIQVMVKPGSEPADYEPKPNQLKHLSDSKVYFSIGVPFEKYWLKKFKDINPKIIISDVSKGIKKRNMQNFYSFESKKIKNKKALDPHIWLSPKLVKTISKNIAKTFINIDPKHKNIYLTNLHKFISQIDSLESYAHLKLDSLKHREFIVFHPVWGYFADEFKLKQIPIQLEGKTPRPKTLMMLIRYAKKHNIKVVFIQPQFSKKSAQVIANNIEGRVITLDPLDEDWHKCINNAVNIFSKTLK